MESVKGSLVHGLTASKTMWELCRNLGFQTGGPWQEAGEDGQDSEHLLQGEEFFRKAGLSVFGLEEIDRCELWMEVVQDGGVLPQG